MADEEAMDELRHQERMLFGVPADEPIPQFHPPHGIPVVDEASDLIRDIVNSRPNLSPAHLHRLARILEDEEARYQEQAGYPVNSNTRTYHHIGDILRIIRGDDEFYDMLCSDFFLQTPVSCRAGGFRVLLACVTCWGFTFSLAEPLLQAIAELVTEELNNPTSQRDIHTEALYTYSLGLYVCVLSGRADVAEMSLSTGQAATFMRYLRVLTLGESSKSDNVHGGVNSFKEARLKQNTEEDDEGDDVRRKKDGRGKKEEVSDGKSDIRAGAKGRGKSKLNDEAGEELCASGRAKHLRLLESSLRKDRNKYKAEQNYSMQYAEDTYMAGSVDISVFVRKALVAVETEARRENAPDEAIKIAKDDAAEAVKSAALEELARSKDEADVLKAAEVAAQAVEDASTLKFVREETDEEAEPVDSKKDLEVLNENFPERETLAFLRLRYSVQCLERLGEYVDILAPVLQQSGVDVCFALLRRHYEADDSRSDMALVSDVLRLVTALSTHRKFAAMFVDHGGIPLMLNTPRIPQTTLAISYCLFAIATLQSAMERVCTSSPSFVNDCVGLAFQLLDATQDLTRKNAAQLLGSAFIFRPVIDAFEGLDGLSKFLSILRKLVTSRNAGSQTPSPSFDLTGFDKQVGFQVCVALRQYFRASFMMLADSLRPVKSHRGGSRNANNARASYKHIDISAEAVDGVIQQLSRDRKLATTFMRAKWHTLDNFMSQGGHVILLELCQLALHDKPLHDVAQYALNILQIVTLFPSTRRSVVGCPMGNGRVGMAVLVDSASGAGNSEAEEIQGSLQVLVNLVCPPPAISSRSSTSSATATASGPDSSSTSLVETKIVLGPYGGGPGLASSIEQSYRFARETLRSNNGIKVLLHLLYPRIVLPPTFVDCIRALACRVLLGLAKDPAIAHILTKLQVGKLLSELLRDGSQVNRQSGGEQDKWQNELSHLALDLMGVVTNAGRAGTVASEAAAPTLRRIERAAIAAATPINYHSRELLQLIHEHLMAAGLTQTALTLMKEAQITPLESLLPVSTLVHACNDSVADKKAELQWPGGRIAGGIFLGGNEDRLAIENSAKKKFLRMVTPRKTGNKDASQDFVTRFSTAEEKTPAKSVKRKANETFVSSPTVNKRMHIGGFPQLVSPVPKLKSADTTPSLETGAKSEALEKFDEALEHLGTPTASSNLLVEQKDLPSERATLDALVGQYLKHQHRQCPAPITTVPPLSLLHPHVCPETSHMLDAPSNVVSRIFSREKFPPYGGLHGKRHDRHYVHSRFRQIRVCRSEEPTTLSCSTFAGRSGNLAVGCLEGTLRIFDSTNGNILESQTCHLSEMTSIASAPYSAAGDQLLLTSGLSEARLWNLATLGESLEAFIGIRSAVFNHRGNMFGALKAESTREVLLYDVNTCQHVTTLMDSTLSQPNFRAQAGSQVHFSPSDILVLWNGVLWDHRLSGAVHRFDQFSDYGGGGFHPGGNEVIINSEVWDLRKHKLLRSVSSLDQTVIKFNSTGDVMYAIMRNNGGVESALNSRRAKHPLFSAFRTIDAVDYSDIATTQVDRCILDLSVQHNDNLISVVVMEPNDSYIKFFDVGRRRPTDDDSDPDDGLDTEEDRSDPDDEEEAVVQIISTRDSSDETSSSDGGGISDASTSDDEAHDGILEFINDGEDNSGDEADTSDSDFDEYL